MKAVGILALQGCVEPHVRVLRSLGRDAISVKRGEDFEEIDRLILPGGESSTMLRLLERFSLFEPLRSFCLSRPTWGVCAGAILLAAKVEHPSQVSLATVNVLAHRNFYGSQRESFSTEVRSSLFDKPLSADFIRAPKLSPLASTVEVLAEYGGDAVLLRENHTLLSSFHVELESDTRLHQYFLSLEVAPR
ncbi:MAG: pyridoxal 5'-phosphate synthase glutaminase subunit PdxT [Bdellovibrionales bacterium]|nr:pyridoxal 5'-phosphate synthase glutaminase subunit PdxT [Bdellovibrionales bacterium]